MALTFTNDYATISTTEYSLPTDSTSRVAQTDDCTLQVFLDLSALTATEEYVVRFYEKYASGGTQRLIEEYFFKGVQSKPIFVSPAFILGEGWDVTATKVAGTDRAIYWSLRKIT